MVFVCGSTSERSYDSEFDDNGAAKAVAEYGATCGEGVDLSDIRLPWHQDEMLDEVVALTTAPVVSVVVCGQGACADSCNRSIRRDDLGRICWPVWSAGRG